MADRYQNRPFPADDRYDRGGDQQASAKDESDPLAELARLIGQTDPFGSMGRANQQVQPRISARDPYQPSAAPDNEPTSGPPAWKQRARQEVPQQDYPQDYPSSVHPLHRYATPRAAPEPDYGEAQPLADADPEPDPSRYDDALYGELDSDTQEQQYGQASSDDRYGYQDGYDEEGEEPVQKRRGGMVTVVVILALAVVGTAAPFAYRTYVGAPRRGGPP